MAYKPTTGAHGHSTVNDAQNGPTPVALGGIYRQKDIPSYVSYIVVFLSRFNGVNRAPQKTGHLNLREFFAKSTLANAARRASYTSQSPLPYITIIVIFMCTV